MEVFLLVSVDNAIRFRVRNAGEYIALLHLVVDKKRALRLVNLAGDQMPGARAARSSAARVRQIDPRVFRSVEYVLVSMGFELLLLPIRTNQLHFVHRRRRHCRCSERRRVPRFQPERSRNTFRRR
ncbi:hypothetical protein MIMGU_mgv1a016330mg [Erythranthe guttata]|uniref:Uncharacterized protein n=1 Tax=Erythranthe guttata TaxID=4155 RepID=A0A022PWB2_ERYGU|nr:hypothetical protein MIMGU_mgv1a016330mg [Erythranthe guttata]